MVSSDKQMVFGLAHEGNARCQPVWSEYGKVASDITHAISPMNSTCVIIQLIIMNVCWEVFILTIGTPSINDQKLDPSVTKHYDTPTGEAA